MMICQLELEQVDKLQDLDESGDEGDHYIEHLVGKHGPLSVGDTEHSQGEQPSVIECEQEGLLKK